MCGADGYSQARIWLETHRSRSAASTSSCSVCLRFVIEASLSTPIVPFRTRMTEPKQSRRCLVRPCRCEWAGRWCGTASWFGVVVAFQMVRRRIPLVTPLRVEASRRLSAQRAIFRFPILQGLRNARVLRGPAAKDSPAHKWLRCAGLIRWSAGVGGRWFH